MLGFQEKIVQHLQKHVVQGKRASIVETFEFKIDSTVQ